MNHPGPTGPPGRLVAHDPFQARTIFEQKRIIEELSRGLANVENRIDSFRDGIEKFGPKAEFYLNMQRKLIPTEGYPEPDPEVVEAWQNFIMMTKLTLNKTVSGLTKA